MGAGGIVLGEVILGEYLGIGFGLGIIYYHIEVLLCPRVGMVSLTLLSIEISIRWVPGG